MAPFNGGEISPGPSVETDEEILDWVARDAETALHPSCTARMGIDELSVVDPATMSVHGVEGLRSSTPRSMPYVTNGNIYAPVMMLAEKAADLILGNTPLAAGRGRVLPARHQPGPDRLTRVVPDRCSCRWSRSDGDRPPKPLGSPSLLEQRAGAGAPRGLAEDDGAVCR